MLVCETRILESGARIPSYTDEDLELQHGDFIHLQDDTEAGQLAQVRNTPTWDDAPPKEKALRIVRKLSDEEVRTAGWRLLLPVRIGCTEELAWTPVQTSETGRGARLVVKTEHGNDLATVLERPLAIPANQQRASELPFVRLASEEDEERAIKNLELSENAWAICREKIDKHRLPMSLVKAHTLLEGNKILFFFASEGRVDFRNLVKDLASIFHTRIELRQIGVRDRSQIVGGCGVCGLTLCCHSCKGMIQSVSIKMAKEQNLALNSTKISGVCGKLLCCLAYEYDAYHDLNKLFPRIGAKIWVGETKGIVKDVNVQTGSVRVMTEDHQYHDVPNESIQTNNLTGKKFAATPQKKTEKDDL